MPRHATPCVAASRVPPETSLDPARAARAQQRNKGGMERLSAPGQRDSQRWAEIRAWAFPAQNLLLFQPHLVLPHSHGKTSFGRHSPFPPSLCGLPPLCIGLAKGLSGGLTWRSLCFLVAGTREQVRLCPHHLPRATRGRRSPCFTCFNVDAT